MNILKSFIFLVIYVSAEKPYNSSAARKISVDLLSLISGKDPGHLQKFLEDYTPQMHDHSHKHKYQHKHAHQHRLGMPSKKKTCRFKDIVPIEFTPTPLSPIRTNFNWDIF